MVQQQIFIGELEQEIQKLDPAAKRVSDMRVQAQSLEKRITVVEDILYRRDKNLDVLRELTSLLPADTFLTMYRNQDCSLQLRGNSPSTSSSDLIDKLEKSPFLKDVASAGRAFRDPQTGKEVFTYSAKCEK
jgi:general secretion pathway protein L